MTRAEDNVYNVTVVADGGDREDGERAVEVTVTDVNESRHRDVRWATSSRRSARP